MIIRFGLVVVLFDETGKDSKRRKYGVEESGVLFCVCYVRYLVYTQLEMLSKQLDI